MGDDRHRHGGLVVAYEPLKTPHRTGPLEFLERAGVQQSEHHGSQLNLPQSPKGLGCSKADDQVVYQAYIPSLAQEAVRGYR